MATTKTRTKKYDTKKALSDYYLYVPLGAGQLLVEKTKSLSGKAFSIAKNRRKNVFRTYQDLANRGHKVAKSIRSSAATRQAMGQAKTARSRVRAAATSVRKAAGDTATATKVAAKKVG
jgi:hypothetical protein